VDEPDRRLAAVALVVVPEPDSILLIRRAERLGDPWSGQVGLPGGGFDPGDVDLLRTAVRETSEEVGVDLGGAEYAGSLDDVAPRTPVLPPVTVRPFVFCLARRPPLTLSGEVAHAFWIELELFRRPGARVTRAIEILGIPRTIEGYVVGEDFVWGMTERILTPFLQLVPPT
jgi:8-oxo-dGTP pyrophosphatase MutT (NUDIX family)